VTLHVRVDRLSELFFLEVWPVHLGDIHLRVAELPEEEVRESHLTGSTNEQIWVWDIRSVEVIGEEFVIDFLDTDLASCDLHRDVSRGVYDLLTASVGEGEDKVKLGVVLSALDGVL